MRNGIKAFVFDVDGTIRNSVGLLRPGVAEMLHEIFELGLPVMFVSEKNYGELQQFIAQVRVDADIDPDKFNPILIANAGSSVKGDVDKRRTTYPLQINVLEEINRIVNKISKDSAIIYRTRCANYHEAIRKTKGLIGKIEKSATTIMFEIVNRKKRYNKRSYVMKESLLNDEQNREEILSLDIVSLKNKQKIASEIKKCYPDLAVSIGETVQVSVKSRLDAIKSEICELENIDIKDVCIIGDNGNDREALIQCGYGLLCNVKKSQKSLLKTIINLQDEGERKFATNNFKDKEVIAYLTNKSFDAEKLIESTKKIKSGFIFEPKEVQMEI